MPRPYKTSTPAERLARAAKIMDLHAKGFTPGRIVRDLGLTHSAVQAVLKQFDTQPKARREADVRAEFARDLEAIVRKWESLGVCGT